MTSQGLSRRRVANASTSSSTFADNSGSDSQWGSINGSTNSSPAGTPVGTHSHAGSAFRGGSKVAFDPRDLDMTEADERGGKMPRLTIMEEVLLLGLKDKQVSCKFVRSKSQHARNHSTCTFANSITTFSFGHIHCIICAGLRCYLTHCYL
jgi:golgi phosphoprotein 3